MIAALARVLPQSTALGFGGMWKQMQYHSRHCQLRECVYIQYEAGAQPSFDLTWGDKQIEIIFQLHTVLWVQQTLFMFDVEKKSN